MKIRYITLTLLLITSSVSLSFNNVSFVNSFFDTVLESIETNFANTIKTSGISLSGASTRSNSNNPVAITCSAMATEITGLVFEDFDYDGLFDSGEFTGIIDITVTATDSLDNSFSATTASDGTYTISGLTSDRTYRVEFTFPDSLAWAKPTFYGGDNGTLVQFLQAGNCANLGASSPASYCQLNPELSTVCFINGDGNTGDVNNNTHAAGLDVLVSFEYNDRGTGTAPNHLANASELGSVWGLVYERTQKKLFSSALLKRHMELGSGGLGMIYVTDPTTATSTPFLDLATLGFDVGSISGRNLPIVASEQNRDSLAFTLIGEVGLGDLDISEDNKTLWVVNLKNKELISIDIENYLATGTTPTISEVSSIVIPDPGCSDGDYRPFGLGVNKGSIFVGVVCSAETSQTASDLRQIVYKFNPTTLTFTEILNETLVYQKGGVHSKAGPNCQEFYPWTDEYDDVFFYEYNYGSSCYPQPMLTDIEFDTDGSLILGFCDRYGHQSGGSNYSVGTSRPIGYPNAAFADPGVNINSTSGIANPPTFDGQIGGEILKAFYDANTNTYTLESNGSGGCGAGNGQGPGGGEFYCGETFTSNHFETAMGGLLHVPGTNQLVANVMDPLRILTGGIVWLDNSDGSATNSDRFEIYQTPRGDATTFSKAAGLGDIEAFCDPAPIEIGNFVWIDADGDGVQDAGESIAEGVTMELYDASGVLLATTTTDVNGQYYFSDDATDAATWTTANDGLDFNTNYYIVAGGNGQYTGGIITLNGIDYELTSTDNATGSNADAIDNDAAIASGIDSDFDGEPYVQITTGDAGNVRHAYDFGFKENCNDPTTSIFAIQPSCNNNVVQSDGVLQISAFTNADRVNWIAESDYSNGDTDYANATLIGALPFQFNTGLSNPSGSQDYTIRVFNGASSCFTDYTVTMQEQDCMVGCDCTEMIYLNEPSTDGAIHKFIVNADSSFTEIGSPWFDNAIQMEGLTSPHGLGVDANGFVYVGEESNAGEIRKFSCAGEILPESEFAISNGGQTNIVTVDGQFLYAMDWLSDTWNKYDICTEQLLGTVTTTQGTIRNWGLHYDEYTSTFYATSSFGAAEDSYLYVFTDADFNASTSITGIPLPYPADNRVTGITTDTSGFIYIVINDNGADDGSFIAKHSSVAPYPQISTSAIDLTQTDSMGYNRAIGIVHSETTNLLFVSTTSKSDDCVSTFDTDLNYLGVTVPSPGTGDNGKGIAITKECCPVNNNQTVDTTLCGVPGGEVLFLSKLIQCEGTICDGLWQDDPSNFGLIYDPCDNSITIDSTVACGKFILESDGTATNAQCGAFKIEINISVNNVTASVIASDQTICSGEDPDAFTVTTTATGGTLTYQWQSSTTDCTTGFTDIGSAMSDTYDPPAGLMNDTYYRVLVNSTNASCPLGMCADTSNCVTVTVNPNPTASAATTDVTCPNITPSVDGSITLTGFSAGERFDFNTGNTYSGSATFTSGSAAIPVDGIIANNLANPSGSQAYTIRIFNSNECFVDRLVTLNEVDCTTRFDFPDYNSALRSCPDEPCHTVNSNLYLGLSVSTDTSPVIGETADSDDDDGLSLNSNVQFTPGNTVRIPVTIYNDTGNPAFLRMWIDWNADGDFEDAGEQIENNTYPSTGAANLVFVSATIPVNAIQTSAIALRTRLSTDDANSADPCGTGNCAADGEIEDYLIQLDCPTPICPPLQLTTKSGTP